MPTYPVINTKTGEKQELLMSMKKYDEWRKENPDWDKSKEYYSRDERKEWDKIGIIGQCYVRKTAVIPSSWIKLKEVDSTKDFYLIK